MEDINKYKSQLTRYRIEKAREMTGSVLDVCGGIGTWVPYFSSDDVTIIDICPEALEMAECKRKVVGDACNMPFGDNEFDSIWACACCYFFDFDKFIKEAYRVGKNGGRIIIEMANPKTPYDIFKKILHMKTWDSYTKEFDYYRMLTPQELMRYGKVTGEVRFFPSFLDKAIRHCPSLWHTMICEITIEKK